MSYVNRSPAVRSRNANLANTITGLRILLTAPFVWLLLADAGRDGALRWGAACVFILAIATDGVDGALARKRHTVTDLGKLLDPVADKVLTGAALVCLSILGELPWVVTVLVLVREIGITVWRLAELRRGCVIPASRGGKLKTILLSVALSFALLPTAAVWGVVNILLMTVAVMVTVVTGADYLWQRWRTSRRPVSSGGAKP
jgi:CDP-diacylglycerol---glycerol-3-phosphate 3-phosphatidyltransferase